MSQYPLSKEADEGIAPRIQALIDQRILYAGVSPCNTSIILVWKSKGGMWRLIQDLRPLNDIVVLEYPLLLDQSIILTNIPVDASHFSVVDIKNVFFSIMLHPDSQYPTAFTFRGVQLLFSRLPQGYCESPSILTDC